MTRWHSGKASSRPIDSNPHPSMKLCLLPLATLFVLIQACRLLPDRVYIEAQESTISGTTWQDQVGGEDPLLGIGLEWDLKPTRVIIEGQSEAHPWDLGDAFGIYDGAEPESPTPITVADEELRVQVEELVALNATLSGLIGALNATVKAQSEDLESMRETSDMLKSILAWITGAGLTSALSLLGIRRYRAGRDPQTDNETS